MGENMKLKKFFSILLSLVMIVGFNLNVQAEGNGNLGENNIKPFYVVSCPSGGKHYMKSIGWAHVYQGEYPGTLKWYFAACYQCIYCNEVIATKSEINNRDPIGDYVQVPYSYPIGTYISKIYVDNFYYEPGKILDGYEFH